MHSARVLSGTAVGLALLALAACDSGTSNGPSTTSRARRSSTTTAAGDARPSDSDGTAPVAPSTTSTSAPAGNTAIMCDARATPITAAVTGGDLGTVPVASYTVTDCRIAPSNQIWAAVNLTPKPGTGVTPLVVVLERVGSIWGVHAYGPDHVGCDAPPPVPTELATGC